MDQTTLDAKNQAKAVFVEEARGIQPATPTPQLLTERLAPYAAIIRKYYNDGYSIEQLITILKKPRIGIEITGPALKSFLRHRRRGRKAATKNTAKPAAKTSA